MNSKSRSSHRRKPMQDLRINPFSSSSISHNNYPELEDAFKLNSSNNDSSSPNQSYSPDRSSVYAPSELNMSIGARAAITEQTRYIAKYGLDGDRNSSTSPNKSQMDEWDRVMDGIPCNTSIIDSHISQSFSMFHTNRSIIDISISEHHALDETCNQSDFFNSSRIMNTLATPERNKQKVDEASRLARLGIGLMTRGDEGVQQDQFHGGIGLDQSQYSTSGGSELEQSGMIGLFQAAMRIGEEHQDDDNDDGFSDDDNDVSESFVSFHEPNMSVIEPNKSLFEGDNFTDIQTDIPGNESLFHVDGDMQASFISYREPDLSLFERTDEDGPSDEIGTSGDGDVCNRSEFDVDVSEIIAPSEFESRVPSGNYSSPFSKISMSRLPTTPEEPFERNGKNTNKLFPHCDTMSDFDEGNEDARKASVESPPSSCVRQNSSPGFPRALDTVNEVLWPENSPVFLKESSKPLRGAEEEVLLKENVDADDEMQVNCSLLDRFDQSVYDSVKELERDTTNAGNLNIGNDLANTSFGSTPSPQKHKMSRSLDLGDNPEDSPLSHQLFRTTPSPPKQDRSRPIGLNSNSTYLSSIDKFESSNNTEKTLGPHKNCNSIGSTKSPNDGFCNKSQNLRLPQRISLRDRYSRPDRFEDNYSTPSSASTLGSSQDIFEDENAAVNRSLLETFESNVAPAAKVEFSPRRYAV